MDFSILLPNEFFTERVFYFVIAFSSLTVLILVLILLYVFQSKKQAKDRLMENEIKDKAYVEAMKIMDSARLKSLKILEESQLKAHKSLDNASSLSKEARAELDRKFAVIYDKQTSTLDGLSQELVKTYKDALEKERKENMQVIDETSDMLKRELTAEVIEITDTVRKGTIEKQKEIEKKLEEEYSGKMCPDCSKPLIVKRGRFGYFLGCTDYPACKGISKIVSRTGFKCPNCKTGDVIEKKSRGRGKIFYACSRWPECDFLMSKKPETEAEIAEAFALWQTKPLKKSSKKSDKKS